VRGRWPKAEVNRELAKVTWGVSIVWHTGSRDVVHMVCIENAASDRRWIKPDSLSERIANRNRDPVRIIEKVIHCFSKVAV
jgi:hypothetical protein